MGDLHAVMMPRMNLYFIWSWREDMRRGLDYIVKELESMRFQAGNTHYHRPVTITLFMCLEKFEDLKLKVELFRHAAFRPERLLYILTAAEDILKEVLMSLRNMNSLTDQYSKLEAIINHCQETFELIRTCWGELDDEHVDFP